MSSVKINILSKTDFVDRTVPDKPVDKVDIIFQLPDTRIGTVTILKSDADKPAEDVAIAAAIKKLGPALTASKEIKL